MTDEPRIHVTDGPYVVTGAVPLVWLKRSGDGAWVEGEPIDVAESYALCRCGASASKPFFDGGGSCGEVPAVPVLVSRPVGWDVPASSPIIAIKPNGPLRVRGVGLSAADGTVFEAAERYSLCRCGRSNTMPFCDGTHKEVEFHG
jgi:CDGSH-type Zn-finger protein